MKEFKANEIVRYQYSITDKQSEAIWMLREKGYSINKQRIALITGIYDLQIIGTPEELWFHLLKQNYKISIASVYSNLRVFVKENLLEKVVGTGRCSSYQLSRIKEY